MAQISGGINNMAFVRAADALRFERYLKTGSGRTLHTESLDGAFVSDNVAKGARVIGVDQAPRSMHWVSCGWIFPGKAGR